MDVCAALLASTTPTALRAFHASKSTVPMHSAWTHVSTAPVHVVTDCEAKSYGMARSGCVASLNAPTTMSAPPTLRTAAQRHLYAIHW